MMDVNSTILNIFEKGHTPVTVDIAGGCKKNKKNGNPLMENETG